MHMQHKIVAYATFCCVCNTQLSHTQHFVEYAFIKMSHVQQNVVQHKYVPYTIHEMHMQQNVWYTNHMRCPIATKNQNDIVHRNIFKLFQ